MDPSPPLEALRTLLEKQSPGLLQQLHQIHFPPPESSSEPLEGAYDKVLDRLPQLQAEQAFLRDHKDALAAFPTLPGLRRDFYFRNSPPRVQRHLLLALDTAARAARYDSPARSLELAELALVYLPRLTPASFTPNEYAGLAARLHAGHANALRLLARYPEAHAAFGRARQALTTCRNPMDHAWVDRLEGVLLRTEGRAPEALPLLNRAIATFTALESPLLPETLIQRGQCLAGLGRHREALQLFRAAYREPGVSQHTMFLAAHSQARCLLENGEPREALKLFTTLIALYADPDFAAFAADRAWLEGSIAAALDWDDQALPLLTEARALFLADERFHDALLVGLELAILHLRAGQVNAAADRARELLDFAATLELGVDHAAALATLQAAAQQAAAQVVTLEVLRTYLSRLPFDRTTRLA